MVNQKLSVKGIDTSTLYNHAEHYHMKGFTPIPIRVDKFDWNEKKQKYKKDRLLFPADWQKTTYEDALDQFADPYIYAKKNKQIQKDANGENVKQYFEPNALGLLCNDRLFVVDVDDKEQWEAALWKHNIEIPQYVCKEETLGGGIHYFFKQDERTKKFGVTQKAKVFGEQMEVDLLTENRCCIVFPTAWNTADGQIFEYKQMSTDLHVYDDVLTELPDSLYEAFKCNIKGRRIKQEDSDTETEPETSRKRPKLEPKLELSSEEVAVEAIVDEVFPLVNLEKESYIGTYKFDTEKHVLYLNTGESFCPIQNCHHSTAVQKVTVTKNMITRGCWSGKCVKKSKEKTQVDKLSPVTKKLLYNLLQLEEEPQDQQKTEADEANMLFDDGFPRERLFQPTLLNAAEWYLQLRPTNIVKFTNGNTYTIGDDNRWSAALNVKESALNIHISRTLVAEFKQYISTAKENGWNAILKKLQNSLSFFVDFAENSRSNQIAENVIRLVPALENNPDLFTSKPHLFAFSDVVIDLNTMQPHQIQPDDYILRHTGYPLPKGGPNEAIRKEILQFLRDIYGTAEESQYVLQVLARAMYGELVEEMYLVHKGPGGNGKSMLLLLVKVAFGDYFYAIDSSVFTNKKTGADQFSSQLCNAFARRILCTSEPEVSSKFLSAILKLISGRDPITTRTLHGKPFTFTITGLLNILVNHILVTDVMDGGIVRRQRYSEYPYEYKDELDEYNNPEETMMRKADLGMKERFRSNAYRDQFILILLETYASNFCQQKRIETPFRVKNFTKLNAIESLPFAPWFNQMYKFTGDDKDMVIASETFIEYVASGGKMGRTNFHAAMKQIFRIYKHSREHYVGFREWTEDERKEEGIRRPGQIVLF
ncbi:hypothetical protein HK097_003178 [Rhizophlyctis rosea]|uniref:SF3 helicase domain-containing protein n=1 Tax=Rhizophlyctis rosea TaxID=64517 RepID=A0AAD5S2W5_9FUNG|nr:hypothetical protein HK097_003178 [Rhizophlyctis rosea]